MARRLVSLLVALVTVTGTTTAVAASAQQHTNEVLDGPDVSSYQHPYGAKINWHQVARQDKDFAIVKATEGRWYKNP